MTKDPHDARAASPQAGTPPHDPDFAVPVPVGGYVWWYVDATSDDDRHALTLIAFVGSVFSPYYALARWRGRGHPENYCALNVALYGAGGHRWAMTERGCQAVHRSASALVIGPSAVAWDGAALTFYIDEWTAPLPRRIRGSVRFIPEALTSYATPLDPAGNHVWRPYAPLGRVEVLLTHPAVSWNGEGYFDSNSGLEPLEAGFLRWDWSRARVRDGTVVLYDTTGRDGGTSSLALAFDQAGGVKDILPPPSVRLPSTALWRIVRTTRSEAGSPPAIRQTLEDTPFYARSLLTSRLRGEEVEAFHESLSLRRFRSPIVRGMLPFRMPRV